MTATQSAPADPRRRLAMIVGVGVALGVVLFLARVLSGASAEETGTFTPTNPSPATPAAPAAPAAPEGAATTPVETFEVFTTKNPFLPLRSAAVAPSSAAPAASAPAPAPVPAPAPAVPAAASTAPPTATPVSTGAGSTTATSGTAPSRPATRVALLDVFTEGDRTMANVKVNDTVSKVAAGDTFSSNFKAVSLDPAERCGRFLYGDDQFRLCKGEELLK